MHTSGKKKYWKLQCKRIIELIICFKDGIPFSYFSRDKFRKTLRIFSRVFNHFTKNISAIISNSKGSLCFIPQTPEMSNTTSYTKDFDANFATFFDDYKISHTLLSPRASALQTDTNYI